MYKMAIIIFFLLIILYEKVWRPMICKKKIHKYILSLNGMVDEIKRLSIREETYLVDYRIGDTKYKLTVKFNLVYKEEWQ